MAFDLCKILGVKEGEVFRMNGCKYKVVKNKMYHPTPFPNTFEEWIMVDYPLNLLAEAEADLDKCSTQSNEGCGRCNLFKAGEHIED